MKHQKKVHNFRESLEYSNKYADAFWWEQVYRKAFTDFQDMQCIREDGWAQRGGIDRIIILSSGKILLIDEKVRKEDWNDILLEFWSSKEDKVKGWIRKGLACDYIAYAFVPSCRCYLLPFENLRRAWKKNLKDWWNIYKIVPAKNINYTTESLAVPIDVLLEAVKDSMTIEWEEIDYIDPDYERKIIEKNNGQIPLF